MDNYETNTSPSMHKLRKNLLMQLLTLYKQFRKKIFVPSLVFIGIMVAFTVGKYSVITKQISKPPTQTSNNNQETIRVSDLPEIVKQAKSTPEPGKPNNYYASYTAPLFPGYTTTWKLFISEENNLLFLYPENFVLESGGDEKHVPIILKDPETQGEIIVQSLEEITSYKKSQEYESFLHNIAQGVLTEKYGYTINPEPSVDVNNESEDNEYGIKELNTDTGKIYYSVYFRHTGWTESVVIRTRNLEGKDDLRAIRESFKFLR